MYLNFTENPFPEVSQSIPESYICSLEKRYAELNDTWVEATQTTDKEGNILSRAYSNLIFPSLPGRLQRIQLSAYDELYEADFYYQLMSYFYEDYYTSSAPFLKWSKIRTMIRQEKTYKHAQTSCFFYERPYTLVLGLEGTYKLYSELPTTHSIHVYVGGSIGMTVECPDNITIYKKDSKTGSRLSGPFYRNQVILCDRLWLEVEFNPTPSTLPLVTSLIPCTTTPSIGTTASHSFITFKSYGEFLFSNYAPSNADDVETLVYPIETPIQTRMRPPGITVREDFWNTTPSKVDLIDINTRMTSPPRIE